MSDVKCSALAFLYGIKYHYRNDNYNGALSDPYNQVHSIATDPVELDVLISRERFKAWPGKTLSIPVRSIDELGNPTGSITQLRYSQNQGNGTEVRHYQLRIIILAFNLCSN